MNNKSEAQFCLRLRTWQRRGPLWRGAHDGGLEAWQQWQRNVHGSSDLYRTAQAQHTSQVGFSRAPALLARLGRKRGVHTTSATTSFVLSAPGSGHCVAVPGTVAMHGIGWFAMSTCASARVTACVFVELWPLEL